MNTTAKIGCALLLAFVLSAPGFVDSSRAAPPTAHPHQDLPPVIFSEDSFGSFPPWTITAEVSGDGTFTVTQQLTGGNPGAFRFMSHRLPPLSGEELSTIRVTHIANTMRYNPFSEGEIRAIDYAEDGIILSFPFADAFSTTQPVIEQDERIFRATKFLRFTAQNSSHAWETKVLSQLTAADFVATDGSGDHPNFLADGSTLRFGFTRTNSRSSTLPPVPADQDLVIDQGVDNWQITIYRDSTNRPPTAVDDWFVLDGSGKSLPLSGYFDVLSNDSDSNHDDLELVEVTAPFWGMAGSLSRSTIWYQLDKPRTSDSFGYTISDGELTSSAEVNVYVDCACTVLCLSNLELPQGSTIPSADTIDLPLIYRVRDQVLKPTPDGRRYVGMYYASNPEILANIVMSETLRNEAVAAVELWQDPLRSLVDGDGSALITQAQVEAMRNFLDHLSSASSTELQQIIAAELLRLGPLDDYVGLTMRDAKHRAIGDAILYLPLMLQPLAPPNAADWSPLTALPQRFTTGSSHLPDRILFTHGR